MADFSHFHLGLRDLRQFSALSVVPKRPTFPENPAPKMILGAAEIILGAAEMALGADKVLRVQRKWLWVQTKWLRVHPK